MPVPSTRRTLQDPIGRPSCWLAGEYTNPTQAGMVHGAYQKGIRAAQECILATTCSCHNDRDDAATAAAGTTPQGTSSKTVVVSV